MLCYLQQKVSTAAQALHFMDLPEMNSTTAYVQGFLCCCVDIADLLKCMGVMNAGRLPCVGVNILISFSNQIILGRR